ncbi:MAG: hypothetical protein NVS3B12_02340 [Acidimicrobiales bacterium]
MTGGSGSAVTAEEVLALADPRRLAALERTGLLDEPAEAGLNRLTRLAARLLGVPVALVSLVDDQRQFFASQTGLDDDVTGTALSHSMCRHVVTSGVALVVDDARLEPLVRDNGAVRDLGVVAYAGVPLTSGDGLTLGSFCAIDTQPRHWSEDDLSVLRDLAASAGAELRLRSVLRTAEAATARMSVLAEASRLLSASLRVDTIVNNLARLTVPRLSDLTTIDLLEDGDRTTAHAAAIAAVDASLEAKMSVAESLGPRFLNPATAVYRVFQTGEPLLYETVDDGYFFADIATTDEQARRYLELGATSTVIVPLVARGQVLGVLTMISTTRSGRRYGPEDLSLAVELGQRAGLAIDNARLFTSEHNVAVALQRSLLPRLPKVPGLRLAARYIVSGEGAAVGGDWYDVLALSDGTTGLAIGDVMGHDLRAAAAMGQLRSVLRSYAWEGSSPALVLDRMDRLVRGLGMADLATAIYARLVPRGDGGHMSMRWANAGHLPPILLTPDRGARLLEGAGSVLIGVGPDGPRTEASVDLRPGDSVVLYTDGVIEDRRRGLDDSLAALLRVVGAHRVADGPDALCERILEMHPDPDDDVAILVVQLG